MFQDITIGRVSVHHVIHIPINLQNVRKAYRDKTIGWEAAQQWFKRHKDGREK
jgi:hypothetical protein